MSTYRGTDGFLALGGAITGTPLIQGAVAQGQGTATIDGASLNGVVRPGDKFTVAGDAQEYEITSGGVIGSTTPNELDISFTPNVQVAGCWADNAQVTFVSNSVAQMQSWEVTLTRPFLDTTEMGDAAEKGTLDIPTWSGRGEAQLDYGDTEQKDLVDQALEGTDSAALAIALGLLPGKQLWGDMKATNLAVRSQRGAIVTVSFDFEGTGVLAANWN